MVCFCLHELHVYLHKKLVFALIHAGLNSSNFNLGLCSYTTQSCTGTRVPKASLKHTTFYFITCGCVNVCASA